MYGMMMMSPVIQRKFHSPVKKTDNGHRNLCTMNAYVHYCYNCVRVQLRSRTRHSQIYR